MVAIRMGEIRWYQVLAEDVAVQLEQLYLLRGGLRQGRVDGSLYLQKVWGARAEQVPPLPLVLVLPLRQLQLLLWTLLPVLLC